MYFLTLAQTCLKSKVKHPGSLLRFSYNTNKCNGWECYDTMHLILPFSAPFHCFEQVIVLSVIQLNAPWNRTAAQMELARGGGGGVVNSHMKRSGRGNQFGLGLSYI